MRPVDWKEVIRRLTVVVIMVFRIGFRLVKRVCASGGLQRPCRLDHIEDRALFGLVRGF